jgi:thiamine kinase-like enzyme
LPKAFTQLGKFHISQRHNQAVYSLLTYQAYDTPNELLAAEHEFLCSFHEDEIAQKAKPVFSKLEIGFPTIVHGDLHPGNIKLHAGKLKFIDWSYSRSSLNLFDLSYIETICDSDLSENKWWQITLTEAPEVLLAYYDAIGEPVENIGEIQRAITLWAKLWAYYNCVKYEDEVEAKKRKREIIHILEME